jgi:hypothetical protein
MSTSDPQQPLRWGKIVAVQGGRLKDRKFLRAEAPKRARCPRVPLRRAELLGTIVQVRARKVGVRTALGQVKVCVALGLSRGLDRQRRRDRGQRLGADAHFGMSEFRNDGDRNIGADRLKQRRELVGEP